MRNIQSNELNRAVSLLNFELENRDEALNVLNKKYKIPKYYLSLMMHKIFNKLGTYDFKFSNKKNYSFWDQFHLLATEEVKSLRLYN